jgi:rubrerythrin
MTVSTEDLGASLRALFVHAHRMERGTAARYRQLADMMEVHNNPDLVQLFRRMAEIEGLHVHKVESLCRSMDIDIGADGAGVGDGGEIPDFEDMHYLHRPFHALMLARSYEERAVLFYQRIAEEAEDDALRRAAMALAAEERRHMEELDTWLARYPRPEDGWDEDPDPPAVQD